MDGWMMDECRWNDRMIYRTTDLMDGWTDGRNAKTIDGWMDG